MGLDWFAILNSKGCEDLARLVIAGGDSAAGLFKHPLKLSYRDLAELARELGVSVAPEHDSTMGHTLCPRVREMLASL